MRISDWSSDACSSDLPARVVDRQDRRGLGAIFGHARPHRLGIVVGAALELMVAAHVAGAVDLGLLVAFVIALAAHRTGVTADDAIDARVFVDRSDEHTSELQSLMRISYPVFCLKKKTQKT